MAHFICHWGAYFLDSLCFIFILPKTGGALEKEKWVLCPICNNKTRIKVRPDTVLENFPLYWGC